MTRGKKTTKSAKSGLDKSTTMHDSLVSVMSQEFRRNSQLTIRIPRRIRDALDAQASREHRTVADVVNNMLEERYPALAARISRR